MTPPNTIPPAKQREMAARLGVETIEIASEHAVFAKRPRELAGVGRSRNLGEAFRKEIFPK
jgi:hypothetical protein